jgi:hypothetical protein
MLPAHPTSSSEYKAPAEYHQVHADGRVRSFTGGLDSCFLLKQSYVGLQHRWLAMADQLQLDVLKESAIKGLASYPSCLHFASRSALDHMFMPYPADNMQLIWMHRWLELADSLQLDALKASALRALQNRTLFPPGTFLSHLKKTTVRADLCKLTAATLADVLLATHYSECNCNYSGCRCQGLKTPSSSSDATCPCGLVYCRCARCGRYYLSPEFTAAA